MVTKKYIQTVSKSQGRKVNCCGISTYPVVYSDVWHILENEDILYVLHGSKQLANLAVQYFSTKEAKSSEWELILFKFNKKVTKIKKYLNEKYINI